MIVAKMPRLKKGPNQESHGLKSSKRDFSYEDVLAFDDHNQNWASSYKSNFIMMESWSSSRWAHYENYRQHFLFQAKHGCLRTIQPGHSIVTFQASNNLLYV